MSALAVEQANTCPLLALVPIKQSVQDSHRMSRQQLVQKVIICECIRCVGCHGLPQPASDLSSEQLGLGVGKANTCDPREFIIVSAIAFLKAD